MQRSKLGRFLDNTVITFISVIFAFFFIRKYIYNFYYRLILASLFGFVVIKTLLHFQNRRYKKLSIQKQEVANIEKYNFALRKMNYDEQLNFFKNLFSKFSSKETNAGIVVEGKILFVISLHNDSLASETIFKSYALAQNLSHENTTAKIEEIAIICNNIPQDITALIRKFNDISFTLFSPIETYALLKKYNYFPKIETGEKTQKANKFTLIRRSFIKKQAKTFFKSGLLVYFSSLFIPYTSYYLITAGVLFLLGAMCLCFGEKQLPISPLSKKLLLET